MRETEIISRIRTEVFGRRVRLYDVVDSTNLRALKLIRAGEDEGTIVIAEEQTAGRGRRGRSWLSEKGKNLLFSLIIKPRADIYSSGLISLTAALAVAYAVRDMYGVPAECRWPNDLMSQGKKFCGILPEAVLLDGRPLGVSLGIGINVNQKEFPAMIADKTVSLSIITGKELDRIEIMAVVLQYLEKYFGKLYGGSRRDILDEWLRFSFQIGASVSVDTGGKVIEGIAEDVADDGSLIVRRNNEKIKILAGDVSYDTRI